MEIFNKNYRDIDVFVNCSFELTNMCNFNCCHCYNRNNIVGDLNFDKIAIILHKIKKLGIIDILLTGGEIFLRKDIVKILDLCYELGFHTTLYTNGSCITEEIAKKISTYQMYVEVSIYGSNEFTYENVTSSASNYKKTIEGIEALRKYNVNYKVKSIIFEQNYDDLKNICELISNYNMDENVYDAISCFLFGEKQRMQPYRMSDTKVKNLLSNYDECRTYSSRYGCCTALKNQFNIDYHGNINPCLGWRSIVVTNVLKENWEEELKEFSESFKEKMKSVQIKCDTCELFEYCVVCPMTFYQDMGVHTVYSEESCRFARIRKQIDIERGTV